jgi:hypothetical protein
VPFARVLTPVAVLVLVAAGCGSDEATRSAGAGDGRPEAPAGMQLLGAQDVVIAVPDSWTQVDADPCRLMLPDRSYVLEESPSSTSALMAQAKECRTSGARDETTTYQPTDESLSVTRGPVYSIIVKGADDPDPTPTPLVRDGLDVEAWVDCADLGGDFGVVSCGATWELRDQDLSFSVQVPGDGGPELLEQMSDSIQRLPEGWTTSETDGTVVRAPD